MGLLYCYYYYYYYYYCYYYYYYYYYYNYYCYYILSLYFIQTQYTASVGIQAFVPSRQGTKDPCVIVGNELISVPWECSFTVSNCEFPITVR